MGGRALPSTGRAKFPQQTWHNYMMGNLSNDVGGKRATRFRCELIRPPPHNITAVGHWPSSAARRVAESKSLAATVVRDASDAVTTPAVGRPTSHRQSAPRYLPPRGTTDREGDAPLRPCVATTGAGLACAKHFHVSRHGDMAFRSCTHEWFRAHSTTSPTGGGLRNTRNAS